MARLGHRTDNADGSESLVKYRDKTEYRLWNCFQSLDILLFRATIQLYEEETHKAKTG